MEKKRIITIGREFGSGGRTIGKEVAERLGIPCYDHELIDRLAEESVKRKLSNLMVLTLIKFKFTILL